MASHRKIYIDSRLAVPGGSASDFSFQLQETVECGPSCVAYVVDICIPVSWQTVTEENRMLYLIERSLDGLTHRRRVVALAPGQYTAQSLAANLQTRLDQTALESLAGSYTVVYDTSANRIRVSNASLQFVVVPESDLRDGAWRRANWPIGPGDAALVYDVDRPRSCNYLLGNTTPRGALVTYPYTSSLLLGVCDVRSHSSLYLHSEALSTYRSLAPTGSRSCIRHIPVLAGYGEVLHEGFTGCAHDCIDASNLTLRTLDFRLLDVWGNQLDLQGGHISFAIVFGEV